MEVMPWDTFFQALYALDFEPFDAIVAIARGGVIPAGFLQQRLNLPLHIIQIRYRGDDHQPLYPHARIQEQTPFGRTGLHLLLVDDVIRSGTTIEQAKTWLAGNTLKTFAVNGPADYRIANEEICFLMPWKAAHQQYGFDCIH